MPAPDSFSVLFVCTGNICRSPLAEQLFRERFRSTAVSFSSAGTRALQGEGMPLPAVDVLRSLGGHPTPHRARQLSAEQVRSADLVIGMSREHRSAVVRLAPRASRYTFTLRQFSRLAASLSQDRSLWPAFVGAESLPTALRAATPALAGRRGYLPYLDPEDDDIPDPYRQGDEAYRIAGDLIDASATSIRSAVARIVAGGVRRSGTGAVASFPDRNQ